MSIAAYDLRKLIQIAVPLAAALLAVSAGQATSRAQATESGHMLVIPASDGYGFDDCLSANKACGRVIADAWCEAHGMAAAMSFGRAEDITGSIGTRKDVPKIETGAFVVSCKD